MSIEIAEVGNDRSDEFLGPILEAFGVRPNPRRVDSWKVIDEVTQRLAALDGDRIVGAAGSFSFAMTIPGAAVPTAGLTTVAVRPTHRRRGIMSRLVRQHLQDARARGELMSALWASESHIYGRFGYGMASYSCRIDIRPDRSAYARPLADKGVVRAVEEEEALQLCPPIWERLRERRPGMLSRSTSWWQHRRLRDWGDGPPLRRVVLELDGQPAAYALYRLSGTFDNDALPEYKLEVLEAVGATPLAERCMWRYLLDLDLVNSAQADLLPTDHVLIHSLAESRRLRQRLSDGLWLRVLDVEGTLSRRRYSARDVVHLAVEDELFADNCRCYRIDGASGQVTAIDHAPDLELDVATLGSALLGGFSFTQLRDAGRLRELVDGGARRADALFHEPIAPWCPELF